MSTSQKLIMLPGVGSITLIKRRGNRSLRLSVTTAGVRVSMPTWTPFATGEAFAHAHSKWIQSEITKVGISEIMNGQKVGKLHYIRFEQSLGRGAINSRVSGTEIVIRLQAGENTSDKTVQTRAIKACIRSLKREAEHMLPARLANLAERYDKHYTSINIKQLKRRWGSCDQKKGLTFNLFLMELSWEYIDYVLLHELAHTEEMNHGPAFWKVLVAMQPRAKDISRNLRRHQPAIGNWQ